MGSTSHWAECSSFRAFWANQVGLRPFDKSWQAENAKIAKLNVASWLGVHLDTAPGGPRTVPVRSACPGTKALTFCSPPQRADMLRTGTVRDPGAVSKMRLLVRACCKSACRASNNLI